jgi:hypothetical protein
MSRDDTWDPSRVRALRGTRSRAAFARLVGVSPLTVYRWELPGGAAQARRPNGVSIQRLGALELGAPTLEREVTGAEAAAHGAMEPSALEVLPALERILGSGWREGERALTELQLRVDRDRPDAAALVGAGLGQTHLLLHNDVRSATAALLPALADARAGRLSPSVEATVQSTAALLFAWVGGPLFDLGRVSAHAARAEALAPAPASQPVRFLAWLATFLCAFSVGEPVLLGRALSRVDEFPEDGLPPLLRGFAVEARGIAAMIQGRPAMVLQWMERSAEWARDHGFALLEVRALALLAMRRLDDLDDPERALASARRAEALSRDARLGDGLQTGFTHRAVCEASLRLGRLGDAEHAYLEAERSARDAGLLPLTLVPSRCRHLVACARLDELGQLGEQLSRCGPGPSQALAHAYGAYVALLFELHRGGDADALLGALSRARETAQAWVFLQRDVTVLAAAVHLALGRLDGASIEIRRARRFLERFPSPYAAAQLDRWDGALHLLQRHDERGGALVGAAQGVFELAGDRLEAALTRRTAALLGRRAGADASALARSDAELRELGLDPRALGWLEAAADRAGAPARASGVAAAHAVQPELERVVAPLRRMAVPGLNPQGIQRELLAVLAQIFPGCSARLEELDSNGRATLLAEEGDAAHVELWEELGDGAGRRLRVGVALPPGQDGAAALQAVTLVAGLALEVATLHGLARPAPGASAGDGAPALPGVVAESPAMRRLLGELSRLGSSRATVLVTGESGTGKEVVARAIHDLSTRRVGPFVPFNCAAVPRDLFEGQLFGYRKGAFTGAVSNHPGVVRAADRGTLLLDEIGELPLELQPKLLRFLENGEVFPLGELRPAKVDVRLVAATHRDLGALVRAGRFREDLYYRLLVVPLRLPPLRERKEDVVALARHFLRAFTEEGVEPPVLGPDAVATLLAHPWPGNVRELRNAIERSLAFRPSPAVLTAAHLRLSQ